MEAREAERICGRLGACWPRPPMDVSEIAVWYDHLCEPTKDFETAMRACKIAESKCKRRPSLAEFLNELYPEARHTNVGRAIAPPDCQICESGFVAVKCVDCKCGDAFENVNDRRCPEGRDTAARCPSGCVPPTDEEREGRWRMYARNWDRKRQGLTELEIDRRVDQVQTGRQEQLAGVRDPSEPRRHDPDEPF